MLSSTHGHHDNTLHICCISTGNVQCMCTSHVQHKEIIITQTFLAKVLAGEFHYLPNWKSSYIEKYARLWRVCCWGSSWGPIALYLHAWALTCTCGLLCAFWWGYIHTHATHLPDNHSQTKYQKWCVCVCQILSHSHLLCVDPPSAKDGPGQHHSRSIPFWGIFHTPNCGFPVKMLVCFSKQSSHRKNPPLMYTYVCVCMLSSGVYNVLFVMGGLNIHSHLYSLHT